MREISERRPHKGRGVWRTHIVGRWDRTSLWLSSSFVSSWCRQRCSLPSPWCSRLSYSGNGDSGGRGVTSDSCGNASDGRVSARVAAAASMFAAAAAAVDGAVGTSASGWVMLPPAPNSTMFSAHSLHATRWRHGVKVLMRQWTEMRIYDAGCSPSFVYPLMLADVG